MGRTEEWLFLLEQWKETALVEYRATHEYLLRKEREEYLEERMSKELSADQEVFVEEIISEMKSSHYFKTDLLYRQGMKDCVWLLKNLGVLA